MFIIIAYLLSVLLVLVFIFSSIVLLYGAITGGYNGLNQGDCIFYGIMSLFLGIASSFIASMMFESNEK